MHYYRRIEDPALQETLRTLLDRGNVAYKVDAAGGVLYCELEADAVGATFHHVLRSAYHGYFRTWAAEEHSKRFRAVLAKRGLPFLVVHYDAGVCFYLRVADKAEVDQIGTDVLAAEGQPS
jgi:hypothetical protein